MKSIPLYLTLLLFACVPAGRESTGEVAADSAISGQAAEDTADSMAEPEEKAVDFSALHIRLPADSVDYTAKKRQIAQSRERLRRAYDKGLADMDSVRHCFTEALLNGLIPYWYGTPYDFEGHTSVPGEGSIACGYFVSTTLLHMGLKLNRYKLAQAAPYDEAKMLSGQDSVITFHGHAGALTAWIKRTFDEGIFFAGIENYHVGFLLLRQGEVFFIHANYLIPAAVAIERADSSEALGSGSVFHLAPLSGNTALMAQWLEGVPLF